MNRDTSKKAWRIRGPKASRGFFVMFFSPLKPSLFGVSSFFFEENLQKVGFCSPLKHWHFGSQSHGGLESMIFLFNSSDSSSLAEDLVQALMDFVSSLRWGAKRSKTGHEKRTQQNRTQNFRAMRKMLELKDAWHFLGFRYFGPWQIYGNFWIFWGYLLWSKHQVIRPWQNMPATVSSRVREWAKKGVADIMTSSWNLMTIHSIQNA